VASNRVSILSEHAQMSHEIDLEKARRDLERAKQTGADTPESEEEIRFAETQIRVGERAR
jgi:F-type H+-transporting ATPase subunit epsilon